VPLSALLAVLIGYVILQQNSLRKSFAARIFVPRLLAGGVLVVFSFITPQLSGRCWPLERFAFARTWGALALHDTARDLCILSLPLGILLALGRNRAFLLFKANLPCFH